MNIADIRDKCSQGRIVWKTHSLERIQERDISRADVKNCIMNGEIIEDYPDDFPYPSVLIFGASVEEKPLHVVCSANEDEIFIITAYEPTTDKFEADLKTRRK